MSARMGGGEVQAMIAAERPTSNESWLDLCNEQGIILAWPALFEDAVEVTGK